MTSTTVPTPELPTLQDAFRNVMGAVCTPVAVVTASSDELPYGTTVSAFTSLSMTPPMVLVSLDKGSDLLAVVQKTGAFGLNVLGSAQSDLALTFARKGGTSKFSGVAWKPEAGVPRLPDTSGFLACTVAQVVEGGDHLVVLGDVVTADRYECPPLTYHGRVFGTHVALGGA